ncbi:hypothetical protein MNBD_NITROSPINAE02-221 [hydrothermal vent metagenome]|uniref:DUF218 domain-containing protein n=1 Tax=hydrothermal vent metagenome TaxID=652676 RepID=A0A3B1CE08_9ZZZZ
MALKWLETAPYSDKADYIVLLPAGGIPGPTMLMRAYKTAQESRKNRKAKIILSNIVDTTLEKSTIWSIREELVARGVPAKRIIFEKKAKSTSDHAKYIKEDGIGDYKNDSYLIITSPSHVKRSILTFRAQGFGHIYAVSATARSDVEDLGGMQYARYHFWGSLKLSVDVIRELLAIGWYKVTGRA